ncbi:MAG: 3',5'-cyclic-nucleotide phosphodiesterase [Nitrospirae bacterium]|nr:3',5'-cyclic-nucleotide phosphodiesterase [Nitrospirota bacterium]
MEIRALGCYGSELPGYRLTGYLLNRMALLDAGTVTSVLSLDQQKQIDYVFVTHPHLDHIRDLSLLADNLIGRRKKPLLVVGIPQVLNEIKAHLLNNSIWPDFTLIPNIHKPVLMLHPILPEEPTRFGKLTVTAFEVNHTVPAVGYLVSDGESSLFFTGDTGPLGNVWTGLAKAKDLRAVLIESSFPNELKELARVSGHLTPAMAGKEIEKLARGDVKYLITHIKSPHLKRMQKELTDLQVRSLHVMGQGEEIAL